MSTVVSMHVLGRRIDDVGGEDIDSTDASSGKSLQKVESSKLAPPPLVIEVASQKHTQCTEFRYLSELVTEDGELTQEIKNRGRAAWA